MEVTRQGITKGLHRLGVSRGDVVEVHSSLSRFGTVAGGAEAVVDVLLAAVGPGGTVVMSAYPVSRGLDVTDRDRARGVTWKVRVLPEGSKERTAMGAVVEEFCGRPGVIVGEGIHRVAAWGRHAERHVMRGYQELVDADGLALLLGVGIDRCSSLHLADSVPLPRPLDAYFRIPDEVRQAYPPDVCIGYHEPPETPWAKAKEEIDKQGLIRKGRIGQADCMLFRVRPMLAAIESILKRDPFAAFGLTDLKRVSEDGDAHVRAKR